MDPETQQSEPEVETASPEEVARLLAALPVQPAPRVKRAKINTKRAFSGGWRCAK